MCWRDVKLCKTSTGQEYLEFNERETKTRSGNDHRNATAIAPKMFAVPNNEKCPVKAYKVYAEKRLAEMKTDDASFYLAVNNVKSGSSKPWFKKAPVGVNKLKGRHTRRDYSLRLVPATSPGDQVPSCELPIFIKKFGRRDQNLVPATCPTNSNHV